MQRNSPSSFILILFSIFLVISCSSQSKKAGVGKNKEGASHVAEKASLKQDDKLSIGPAGTLVYRGVVNGKAKFKTSDCGILDGKLITFNAPHSDESKLGPKGPFLVITSKEAGYVVNFTSDNENSSPQNSFIRMKLKQGISVAKEKGVWAVTFNGMRLSNIDILDQSHITLNGTLTCTNILK